MIYQFFPKSRGFHWAARQPEIDVVAQITGAGYGKTVMALNEGRYQLCTVGRRWRKRNPGLPYLLLIIEPTYPMVRDVAVPIWFEFWPEKYTKSWSKTENKLVTTWGAEVLFRSAEKIDRVRGTRPNLVILDEAREMDQYALRLMLNRVSFRRGKVLLTTTPQGFDWTYEEVEQKAKGSSRIQCFHATSFDNPLYSEQALLNQRELLGEELYRQEVLGQRISFSGRVYTSFDAFRHVDAVGYEKDWPIHVCMDFNVDPMSAALAHPWGATGWQVFDEFVIRYADTDRICEEILKRYSRHNGGWIFYPDPTGGAHHSSSKGRSDHSILREWFPSATIRARPPGKPAVRDRVIALNRLFRKGLDNKEKTRFAIDPRCKTLIQGLEQVGWKKNVPDEQIHCGHITAALGYMEEYVRPVQSVGLREIEYEKPEKRAVNA